MAVQICPDRYGKVDMQKWICGFGYARTDRDSFYKLWLIRGGGLVRPFVPLVDVFPLLIFEDTRGRWHMSSLGWSFYDQRVGLSCLWFDCFECLHSILKSLSAFRYHRIAKSGAWCGRKKAERDWLLYWLLVSSTSSSKRKWS